jgi:flagellar biogenesis protein FliO
VEIVKSIIYGVGFLIVLIAPVVALAWVVYRLVRRDKSNDLSIK